MFCPSKMCWFSWLSGFFAAPALWFLFSWLVGWGVVIGEHSFNAVWFFGVIAVSAALSYLAAYYGCCKCEKP